MSYRPTCSVFTSLALAAMACNQRDPAPPGSAPGSARATGSGAAAGSDGPTGATPPAAGSGQAAGPDWVTRKLVPARATVDGVSFTINVPDGLPPHHSKEPGAWIDNTADDQPFSLHVFTVVLEGPLVTSLDKAKYQATLRLAEASFVRAEQRGGVYALTNQPDSDIIEAVTFTRAGDRWLKCKATRVGEQQIELARGLVEAICDSVRVE